MLRERAIVTAASLNSITYFSKRRMLQRRTISDVDVHELPRDEAARIMYGPADFEEHSAAIHLAVHTHWSPSLLLVLPFVPAQTSSCRHKSVDASWKAVERWCTWRVQCCAMWWARTPNCASLDRNTLQIYPLALPAKEMTKGKYELRTLWCNSIDELESCCNTRGQPPATWQHPTCKQ